MSTNPATPNAPNCNSSAGDREYYDPNPGQTIGAVASIPFLIGSIVVTCLISCLTGMFAKSQYASVGWGIWTIILFILFLVCCASCLKSSYDAYSNYTLIKDVSTGPNSRPCYSDKEKKTLA